MLLRNAKCLTEHLSFLVHGNRLLWLLSCQEALFSLCEIILLLIRLGLLKLHACHTLWVVLTSNLDG